MPLYVVTGHFITLLVYYWKNGRFIIFNSMDDSMAVGRFTTIHSCFHEIGLFHYTGRAVLFDTK